MGLRNSFAAALRAKEFQVRMEVEVPGARLCPADILVEGVEDNLLALNISVVHELYRTLPQAKTHDHVVIGEPESSKNRMCCRGGTPPFSVRP